MIPTCFFRSIRFRNSGCRRRMSDGGRGSPGRGQGSPGRGRGALDRFTAPRRPPQFANPIKSGRGEFGDASAGRGSIRKPNFAKTFLEPAERGELKGHSSGIPKLAARVGKSSTIKNDYGQRDDEMVARRARGGRGGRGGRGRGRFHPRNDNRDPNRLDFPNAKIQNFLRPDPNYDSEDDYDEMVSDFDISRISTDPRDGSITLQETPSDYEDNEDDNRLNWGDTENDTWAPPPRPRKQYRSNSRVYDDDALTKFYLGDYINDDDDPVPRLPKEFVNSVLPMEVDGDTVADFLGANIMHPTKYAMVTRMNHHPESLRLAKPIIPFSRNQPDLDFVHNHMRFAFVTGLPHHILDDGEAGDINNPLHRFAVASMVANLFDVDSKNVFPANMQEAFIGFTTKVKRNEVMLHGPKENVIVKPLKMTLYKGNEHPEFCKETEAVVRLTNVPPHLTPGKLAYILFPSGSKLEQIYGSLTVDQVLKSSDTTMLIKIKSEEAAASMLASNLLAKRLEELGTHKIQYFKAKRELMLKGFTGPNNWAPKYLRGDKMVVAGDVPSDKFMRCHASCLHIRGLSDDWTKEALTQVFQKYSQDDRDTHGSIEFITCARGEKTGRAYIGFDRYGEAEAVVNQTKGKFLTSIPSKPPTFINVKAVKDKYIPFQSPKEERPERTTEELLADLEWTNFVKKEDIDYLDAAGVATIAIRDAFRVLRFQNHTFGPADQSLARERVQPEFARGEHLRVAMQMYIDHLKENLATVDNPGEPFLNFFSDEEEVDYGQFDVEKERVKKLQKKRNMGLQK